MKKNLSSTLRETSIYRMLKRICYSLFSDKHIANQIYKKRFKKDINWGCPQNINEKINWLKFYSDTSEWTRLADKYSVRDFIKECGYKDILIPLYGKWDNANDININQLPESFVLKTNHGSGSIIIVKDKKKINWKEVVKDLNFWLKEPYGHYQGEPHYLPIKRCIIAEALLTPDSTFSSSLIDYKIWSFNGQPKYIWACYNRTSSEVSVELYDTNWNYCPEKSRFTEHYRDGGGIVPKPHNLEKMLEIASRLSIGFPQVRVDLYENGDKVYFGELTFTSYGGYMDFYTEDFLRELGDYVKL